MNKFSKRRAGFLNGGAAAALTIALLWTGTAAAQTASQPAAAPEEASADATDIIVTGTRIERSGFNQPTPMTVIGESELRQGNRPSIADVLADSPSVRPTQTTQTTNANTASGASSVDLRGLGTNRTLTLLNGRRFVGANNLDYVPLNLVQRVDVVTGGASAAYGSDAVAGVVNIILKEDLEGFSVGGVTGISSRGDGRRYGFDASYGTSFADGRGHFMIAGEYVKDASITDRRSRPNLLSPGVVPLNPTDPTDNRQILVSNALLGNVAQGGLITTGVLAGQVFNYDGSLRAFRSGTSLALDPATTPFPGQMLGGEDGVAFATSIAVTSPRERYNGFARATYEVGNATLWVEGVYARTISKPNPFIYNVGLPMSLTISADNPFLSQTIRDQLAAAGETSFTLGKFFDDNLALGYRGSRRLIEGAVGISGNFGDWKYEAHYSHGETLWKQRVPSTLTANFNNAAQAVLSGGQIVCGINADATTANDDPACRPLNFFGRNAYSPESLAYVMGTEANDQTNKLDSVEAHIQGDLFSLWAGPATIVVGAEARWEEQKSVSSPLDLAGAFAPVELYGSPIQGGFNVKEAFGELALPILDVDGKVKIDLNGAVRYSDYSRSGGIWSWKGGGTIKLFDSLTFRGTASRDIRAPSIAELFTANSFGIGPVIDGDSAGRAAANPLYNPTPTSVVQLSGGNLDLVPEVGRTNTFGVTFAPKFIPGLDISADYYDIKVSRSIAILGGTQLTIACANGSSAACASITRDATGTITDVRSNFQNIASFRTTGLDLEARYRLPMSSISDGLDGSLQFRALGTYVKRFVYDTGVSQVDSAGDLASDANAVPHWRGTFSISYQGPQFGVDARVRFIGSGLYNHLLDGANGAPLLVNNRIPSYAYFDLGAQARVKERLTLFANVNNLFNKATPIGGSTAFYDLVGTYFTAGARVEF